MPWQHPLYRDIHKSFYHGLDDWPSWCGWIARDHEGGRSRFLITFAGPKIKAAKKGHFYFHGILGPSHILWHLCVQGRVPQCLSAIHWLSSLAQSSWHFGLSRWLLKTKTTQTRRLILLFREARTLKACAEDNFQNKGCRITVHSISWSLC